MKIGKFFIRSIIVGLWIFLFYAIITLPHWIKPASQNSPVLNVFSWPEVLCPETIQRFEKETGIKIKRHYYTTNEELLVKLKSTNGNGYDLIIPSDYMVKKLIQEELVAPLDLQKLHFIDVLNPKLTNQEFDPHNRYSIPYTWDAIGFGINTADFVQTPFEPNWKTIFSAQDPQKKISMINDPIEAIDVSARYLFGNQKEFSAKETQLIASILKQQKPFVESYSGVRGDYLLITKNCSIAVIPASYVLRGGKNYSHIDFKLPKEYTFLSIENFCLVQNSPNQDFAYTFLNYIYQEEVIANEANLYCNFPAITNVKSYINSSALFNKTYDALENYDGILYFTRDLLSEKEARTLWIELKSTR